MESHMAKKESSKRWWQASTRKMRPGSRVSLVATASDSESGLRGGGDPARRTRRCYQEYEGEYLFRQRLGPLEVMKRLEVC